MSTARRKEKAGAEMSIVLHAASVHVSPHSRSRHERMCVILDAAGAEYTVNDTLDVQRDTVIDAGELPRLAVRRPPTDVVFASYENIVEWNDAGTLRARLKEATAHGRGGDKEIFKENLRLRSQLARTEAELVHVQQAQRAHQAAPAPAAHDRGQQTHETQETRETRETRETQQLRSAAAEAIAATTAAEHEIDLLRAREVKLRDALRTIMQMVPTLMHVTAALAE